ncbi:hypothetical protein [Cohnella boryungensis]|uniref:Fibronectin type-III domain-containing protein n=1 Tax=Cohnella boryungensis TaxID=768479 RepID=A0ABV8SF17_9BACL
MKKLAGLFLSVALAIGLLIPAPSVSAYPGGLLDGKLLNIGPDSTSSAVLTSDQMTDNDEATYYSLPSSTTTSNVNDVVWFKFDYAKDITGYKLKSESTQSVTDIWFFDVYGNSSTLKGITSGASQTISKEKIIKVSVQQGSGSVKKLFEIDFFGFDSTFDVPTLNGTLNIPNVDLNWSTVLAAPAYNIKRSTTPGGPYQTLATVTGTTYTDTTIEVGQTYYYVVTTINGTAESENSNEVEITYSSPSRALLTIYISGGQIKEYDLSAAELNAFLSWYDAKDAGSGPAKYKFVKTWNKGPFKARSEYVIFDKILTFDVDEYEVENP